MPGPFRDATGAPVPDAQVILTSSGTGIAVQAGTAIPASDINPVSLQIVKAFRQDPGLPTAGAPATGLAQFDYAVQV